MATEGLGEEEVGGRISIFPAKDDAAAAALRPPPPVAVNFREREMLLKGKKETRRRKKRVQTRIKEEKVSQTSFSNRPIHCLRGLGRKKRGGNCFFEKKKKG